MAAVVNPRFKLDWLDDQAEKIRMIALLKERVAALHALEQQIAANAQASTSADRNQVQAQQPQQVSPPLQMMRTSSLCLERNDRHNKLRVLTILVRKSTKFFVMVQQG